MPRGPGGSGFEFTVMGAIFFADTVALSSLSAHFYPAAGESLHGSFVGTWGLSRVLLAFCLPRYCDVFAPSSGSLVLLSVALL